MKMKNGLPRLTVPPERDDREERNHMHTSGYTLRRPVKRAGAQDASLPMPLLEVETLAV